VTYSFNSFYSHPFIKCLHHHESYFSHYVFIRLPWIALERWTNLANETTESDVYSFGMTVWEIFSYGDRPLSFIHSIDQVEINPLITYFLCLYFLCRRFYL